MKDNEEVNVSNPTEAQLQTINPYNFINLYKNGYTSTLNTTGNSYVVHLTSTAKDKKIKELFITIDKQSYHPTQVKILQGKSWTEFNISNLSKSKIADSEFRFNAKDFPKLYRLLRRNNSLSTRRSPLFEQSKWAKALLYFGGAVFALYLIIYGIIIAMTADGYAGVMVSMMPVILIIDYLLRFIFQTTPGVMVKPYILQPISRYTAIECFLISSHFSGYNFLWLAMFLPYSFIILIAGAGFWPVLIELLGCQMLIMLNSQVYLFFRTLINRNVLWFLASVVFYLIPFWPLLMKFDTDTFAKMLDLYSAFGRSGWMLLVLIACLVGLFLVNRYLQFRFIYEEISKKKEHALKHISQFGFLNRFGLIGEYLKIEIKSNMRNKAMRSRCIMILSLIVVFSSLTAYTDVYNSTFMTNFWCIYCFALFGVASLTKFMGQEGNYIDLLMVHEENIIALLKAKFWFYTIALLIPFLIMLPAVFTGKFTWLMIFAYMSLTAGLVHFILFQLAVYNKQTIPLQLKITSGSNIENGWQIVIEMVALCAPGIIVSTGFALVGETPTYIFMILLGLVLVALHPLWIRNIYKRMMKRRYENLEGFHATRQ